jgi:site-specific DNA-methyltransferase (adenine-specific)
MWIYSSGFPKSQDIGKQLDKKKINNEGSGWGTALKPAHEPIALARKPTKLSFGENSIKHGVGGLNIDATRVGNDTMIIRHLKKDDGKAFTHHGDGKKNWDSYEDVGTVEGRFPSNVIGEILQEDYQKYFYCPKVSRKERHIGFGDEQLKNWEIVKAMGGHYITADGQPILEDGDFGNQAVIPGYGWINLNGIKSVYEEWCKKNNVVANHGNNHPTVKPVELMKYLIKLITPPNSVVLDPFNGSGSTGMAAVELGHTYIGCELDPAYVEIAKKRIEAWNSKDTNFNKLFE